MSSETERFEFRLPDPGEGLTEARLIEWHVEAGQRVVEDELLCEIETDKAVVEIPIPCTGEVDALVVDEGDVASVGEVIAIFETDEPPHRNGSDTRSRDAVPDDTPVDAQEAGRGNPNTGPETAGPDGPDGVNHGSEATTPGESFEQPPDTSADSSTGTTDDRVFAAPSTRRYAREHGVDLSHVSGSGPDGRVLMEDITSYMETDKQATDASAPESDRRSEADRVTRRPLSGLQRTMADNMARSKREIPHATMGFEANAEKLVDLKERLDEKYEFRITYTPIILKAVVPALRKFPIFNASIDIDNNEIIEKQYYNVGVATHTEDGLLVPVITSVESKSIVEISNELRQIVEEARNQSLGVDDFQDATFTVTNTGSHGGHGTFGTPVINPPQTAILGTGTIEHKPVAVDADRMTVQRRIGLTVSFDHRVIDGMTATRFTEYVIESLEDPGVLLSRL